MRAAGRIVVLGTTGFTLWALGSVPVHAQASPSLTVRPSAGTVGTTVTILGEGFCGSAACSSVQLSFAGILVQDAIAVGEDGAFRLSLTVPGGLEPGLKSVSASQTDSDSEQLLGLTTFQVTLQPPAVTPVPSPTEPAGPSPTLLPTTTPAPPAEEGGTSGWVWGMVVAAAVALAALVGMAYVLWRSREVPAIVEVRLPVLVPTPDEARSPRPPVHAGGPSDWPPSPRQGGPGEPGPGDAGQAG
ncbi:MAG: hypothetical protein ACRDHS_11330 [Actinomycetota bacterium]